jgi:Glycosyl transferase family 2
VIEAVGVVVPAHNEGTLLPACLTALRQAARLVSVPVHMLVVADSCTDRTVAVARACGAPIIGIRARNVGAARAAGMTELLRLTAGPDPAAIWLATTDADTVVPRDWLQRQVAHADRGWDVVLGTVTVADWSEHPPHAPAAFAARYESGDRPHPHVHGANIGIRASAYRAAGGFRPLRTAEDHALLAAVAEAGCSVLRAGDVTVETSGRRHARAPHGFSHLLRTLTPEGPVHGEGLARPPPAGRRSASRAARGPAPNGRLALFGRVDGRPAWDPADPEDLREHPEDLRQQPTSPADRRLSAMESTITVIQEAIAG